MSEAKTFNFELVSPEAKLMSEQAWQVMIPGEEGYMGVRANHAATVATIKPGVVEIWKTEGDNPEKIFIAGGFADITADNLTVLAEEAENLADLSAADLDKQIQNLNDEMGVVQDDLAKSKIEQQITFAEIKKAALAA
ncbi:MAG: ATP synthase F1 subunit epsilon [Pseudomonadota bacterium]